MIPWARHAIMWTAISVSWKYGWKHHDLGAYKCNQVLTTSCVTFFEPPSLLEPPFVIRQRGIIVASALCMSPGDHKHWLKSWAWTDFGLYNGVCSTWSLLCRTPLNFPPSSYHYLNFHSFIISSCSWTVSAVTSELFSSCHPVAPRAWCLEGSRNTCS